MGNFHNNQLPNNHFRKDWQERVRTWFNQPGRAVRRHRNRVKRAASLGAKPLKPLMPAVRCQTVRYNMKLRKGYGFTLEELKEAGLHKREARGLGIKVDYRRRNTSAEGKKLNVDRLNEYKTRLIVFPRKTRTSILRKKEGKMDEDKKTDKRFTSSDVPLHKLDNASYTQQPVPILKTRAREPPRKITSEEREFNAYQTLREAWQWEKDTGKRDIEAKKGGATDA